MNHIKFHTDKLRASGLRPTKQRLAICKILFDRKETFHFTIDQLQKIAEKKRISSKAISLDFWYLLVQKKLTEAQVFMRALINSMNVMMSIQISPFSLPQQERILQLV